MLLLRDPPCFLGWDGRDAWVGMGRCTAAGEEDGVEEEGGYRGCIEKVE